MMGESRARGIMEAQWLLRVLDFLSVSMVIPTMAQFLTSAGGTPKDYYWALLANTAVQLASNLVVGIAVDRTGRVRELYIPLCVVSVLGGVLYAAADAVEALRSPVVIMAARMLAGAGCGKATLVFVVLARLAKEDGERNRWLVALATARSLGLFVGPALAVVLTALAGGIEADAGRSWLGAFALPGIFLAVGYSVATVWLLATLHGLPPPSETTMTSARCSLPASSSLPRGRWDLLVFFCLPDVVVVVMNCCMGVATAPALEYIVPILCTGVLSWGANGSGAVLMAISLAVVTNQLILMCIQRDRRLNAWATDVNLMAFGSCGLALTLLVSSVVWAAVVGVGPFAVAATRAHWILVVGPIVFAECWFPYLGNGGNMIFTRLILTHVPWRMGICQALVTQNAPVLGTGILTAWLGVTYSGKELRTEGAPQTAIQGIAAVNVALCAATFACFHRLRPQTSDTVLPIVKTMATLDLVNAAEPLLSETRAI